MNLIDYIKLLRPPLAVLGFLASYSLMVYYEKWGSNEAWYILLAIGFGNIAFNTFNELVDIEVDRRLKPWKPLPSGKVRPIQALVIASLSLLISLIFLLRLSLISDIYVILGVFGYIGAGAYNLSGFKGIGSNIGLGLTYFCAAYMSSYPDGLYFALFFGILTVAFNIAVQIQDYKGDLEAEITTVPIQIGVEYSQILSLILTFISFLFLITSEIPYVSFMMFVIVILLLFGAHYHETPESYEILCRKMGRFFMILGFISLIAGW